MPIPVSVALPEDEYLTLIGQLAYMVSSLEWTLLGDLAALRERAPELPEVADLAAKSTGQIAGALEVSAPKVTDEEIRTYYTVGAKSLRAAARLRNDVLHARPATVGGEQRLYRWTTRPGQQLAVSKAWLLDAIEQLNGLSAAVNAHRPAVR